MERYTIKTDVVIYYLRPNFTVSEYYKQKLQNTDKKIGNCIYIYISTVLTFNLLHIHDFGYRFSVLWGLMIKNT